jgi:hypothetical protein
MGGSDRIVGRRTRDVCPQAARQAPTAERELLDRLEQLGPLIAEYHLLEGWSRTLEATIHDLQASKSR